MPEAVNHPKHYSGGKVECIDAIESAVEGLPADEAFCLGNIFKYLWRYNDKNGAEDIAKARWYIGRLGVLVRRRLDKAPEAPAQTAAKPVDDKSDCERADQFGLCKEFNAKCPATRCFLYRKGGEPVNSFDRRPETPAERNFIDELMSAVKDAEGEDSDGDDGLEPFIRVVRIKGGPAVTIGVRGAF